jgi:hypothetical protein
VPSSDARSLPRTFWDTAGLPYYTWTPALVPIEPSYSLPPLTYLPFTVEDRLWTRTDLDLSSLPGDRLAPCALRALRGTAWEKIRSRDWDQGVFLNEFLEATGSASPAP